MKKYTGLADVINYSKQLMSMLIAVQQYICKRFISWNDQSLRPTSDQLIIHPPTLSGILATVYETVWNEYRAILSLIE